MRIMYDADRPGEIPRDAQMVAGYLDGSWSKWDASWWGWFPTSKLVTISAVGVARDAQVFDVEPGAIWPPENVIQLIADSRAAGRWPSVYCNQKQHWPYIRNMFRMREMEEPPYWVANYDGVAEIPPGAVAKQYMHPPQVGKHYDVSAVADYWRGVDQEEDDVSGEDVLYNLHIIGPGGVDTGHNLNNLVYWTNINTDKIPGIKTDVKNLGHTVDSLIQVVSALADQVQRLVGVGDPEVVATRAKELIVEDLADEDSAQRHPHPGEPHQGL